MKADRKTPPPLPPVGKKPPPLPVSLLSAEELDRFKNLLVFAQTTVEGYFAGRHRSPYRGTSAEFADYKEYVAGDDVKQLDWRVYGRSRRLFVRQYEEETDMVVYLLVDTSASMGYAGPKRQSKYLLAARVAAALSYLMMHQGDKTALGLFSDHLYELIPPGGTRRHLHSVVTTLERIRPSDTTGMVAALQEGAAIFRKRGRLVVLSDFHTDRSALLETLGQFLHRRFEVLLLQILDPDELHLPSASATRFRDMETKEEIEVEPEDIRADYQKTVRQSLEAFAESCAQHRIAHACVDTREPYWSAIEAYLGFRGTQRLRLG